MSTENSTAERTPGSLPPAGSAIFVVAFSPMPVGVVARQEWYEQTKLFFSMHPDLARGCWYGSLWIHMPDSRPDDEDWPRQQERYFRALETSMASNHSPNDLCQPGVERK